MQQSEEKKNHIGTHTDTHTRTLNLSHRPPMTVRKRMGMCCSQPRAAKADVYARARAAEGRLKTANGSSNSSSQRLCLSVRCCCGAVGRRFTLNRQVATRRERVVSVFIAQHYNHNDIHFRCARRADAWTRTEGDGEGHADASERILASRTPEVSYIYNM